MALLLFENAGRLLEGCTVVLLLGEEGRSVYSISVESSRRLLIRDLSLTLYRAAVLNCCNAR